MPNGDFNNMEELLQSDLDIEILLKQNLGHIIVVDQSLQIHYSNRQEDDEQAIKLSEVSQMYLRRINAQLQQVISNGQASRLAITTQQGLLYEVQIYPLKRGLCLMIFNNLNPFTAQIEEVELGDEKYKALVENSFVAIIEFDMSLALDYLQHHELQLDSDEQLIEIYNRIRVMYYNQAYQDIYNIRPETPMQGGGNVFARDPTQKKIFADFIRNWYSGEETIVMEADIITSDGEKKTIIATYNLLPGHGMKYLLGSLQDITPLKTYQQELEQKKEQLYQSMKMWGVGQTMSSITHDFNNYLNILQSQLDLIEAGINREDMLKNMRSTIVSATKLSKNILNYTKMNRKAEEVEYMVLDASLDELVSRLKIITNDKITIFIRLDSDMAQIRLKYGELEQLLLNLLMNANDAMPKGGRIMIQTSRQAVEERNIIQLRVSDTGEGMEQNTMSQLFDPFFTTKLDTGTGLGMTIIRDIVTKNGGTISVESVLGQGTTFVIEFPQFQSL